MTTIRYFVLVLILACSPSNAADNATPQITVSGTATTMVEPNILRWRLRVMHTADDIEEVAAMHSSNVANALGILAEAGVAESDIQTSRMQFGENWVFRDSSDVMEGYFARTDVAFETESIDMYSSLWRQFASAPGVSVTHVGFDHSDRIGIRNEARNDALLAAKDKAASMAEVLGSTLGPPVSIEEVPSDTRRQFSNSFALYSENPGQSGNSGDISLGQIAIQARVTVSFELRN